MDLSELITQTADAGLSLQRDDGSFPPGENGPYENEDTPVRNTAHWAITLANAYERSGKERFLEGVERSMDFLCSQNVRPDGYTFKHRDRQYAGQDQANGLIGQAWTIESLAVVSKTVNRPELMEIATDTFLLHPFNKQTALWKIVDTDGTVRGYDGTFNHQLWFAMAGGLLAKRLSEREHHKQQQVERRVNTFMSKLASTMRTFPSGLIIHPMLPANPASFLRNIAKSKEIQADIFKKWTKMVFFKAVNSWKAKSTEEVIKKSVPYHPFNLYALGVLKDVMPESGFWKSKKLQAVYDFSQRKSFLKSLEGNPYSYGYNPPGFELPFFWIQVEGSVSMLSKKMAEKQIKHSYDFEKNLMTRGTDDENTHAARFYECTRLPNFELDLSDEGHQ